MPLQSILRETLFYLLQRFFGASKVFGNHRDLDDGAELQQSLLYQHALAIAAGEQETSSEDEAN